MKYLFLCTILLACKNGSRKVITAHNVQDTTTGVVVKRDTSSIDMHDPFETGKDTILLNKVVDKIFKFPEVEAIDKQINKNSKGTHGVSIMVEDEFEGNASYYHFMVGDNSHAERYENIYDFLLEKKTEQIKAYDHLSGSIMSLKDWRKSRN